MNAREQLRTELRGLAPLAALVLALAIANVAFDYFVPHTLGNIFR